MAEFDWDEANVAHIAERHITISEVQSVFRDDAAVAVPAYNTPTEVRFAIAGMAETQRFLTVIYTWRGPKIRSITARPASRRERMQYQMQGGYQ